MRIRLLRTLIFAAATVVPAGSASAQGEPLTVAIAERGPRFFLSAPREMVRLDVTRTTVLRRRVTVRATNAPLKAVLTDIARQAKLQLMFSPDLVRLDSAVTLHAEGISVAAALTEMLMEAAVDVVLSPSGQITVVERLSDSGRRAEVGSISGKVTARATSQPIGAATVALDGVGRTATGDDGTFRITGVTAGIHTVAVRYLGYVPESRTVTVTDNQTVTVDFALTQGVAALDQVIVTGTAGAVERRAVGNAVARIDAASTLEVAPVTDVAQLLNGRASGVVLTAASGAAGAGAKISIRGRNSLSLTSQPLVYLDGVRIDATSVGGPVGAGLQGAAVISRINDINPNDIESIEIIKGPAAATLYGTEASNGVIQIITKAGSASDKPRINVAIEQGTNTFHNANSRIPTNLSRTSAGQIVSLNAAENEEALGQSIWRTGYYQRYDIATTGGTEATRYRISGNVLDEEGVDRTNTQRQMSGRANLQLMPRPSLSARIDLGLINGKTTLTPQEGQNGPLFGAILANPLLKDAPSRGFNPGPPEVTLGVYDVFQLLRRTTASAQLEHQVGSYLRQRLTTGVDYTAENNENIVRRMSAYQAQFFSPLAAEGRKDVQLRDASTTTVDYSVTLDYPLRATLISNTSFGAQYYDRFTRFTNATGTQFAAPGLETIVGTAVKTSSDDYVENATVGAYVQQQVAWRNRLFLTGAVRVDNNSAFGEDYELATYPKVSASWVVNEEPFWNVGFVNTLRLRAAYGAAGQQPDAFAALRTLAPRVGAGDQPALTTQSVGNADLKPERSSEMELGFDAELLQQRLGLEFTYYRQQRRDAILQAPIAPSSGFTGAQFINAGQITNTGAEVKATVTVVDGARFGWSLGASLSTNSNKIDDLGGQPPIFVGIFPRAQQHRVGFPVAGYYSQRIVSAMLTSAGVATDVMCDAGSPGAAPVVCGASTPLVFVGRSTPKYEGAVTSTLRLSERVRLYSMVDFKGGFKRFSTDEWARCAVFRLCEENYFPERFSAVRNAYVQRGSGLRLVEGFIHDASFAKLREVSLNVDVPQNMARHARASEASVTLSGRNLWTWTSWPGLDPDSEQNGAQFGELTSTEQAILPLPMQFRVRLNLTY